ncbi:leucine-rich repeat protein [Plasmodium sp. DRC-Itaito]|nr:leucine-rich repeat protein [Plasmodium sp. DRC-Itaito]
MEIKNKTENLTISNLFRTCDNKGKTNMIMDNKSKLIIDSEKKKNIWSIFTKLDDSNNKKDDDDLNSSIHLNDNSIHYDENESIENFFSPRNIMENDKKNITYSNGTLFKNREQNYEIKNEIENISNSFKRKYNILLTEKTDDNMLNDIISIKKMKKDQNMNCPSYNSYREFFLKSEGNKNNSNSSNNNCYALNSNDFALNNNNNNNNNNMIICTNNESPLSSNSTSINNKMIYNKIENDDISRRINKINNIENFKPINTLNDKNIIMNTTSIKSTTSTISTSSSITTHAGPIINTKYVDDNDMNSSGQNIQIHNIVEKLDSNNKNYSSYNNVNHYSNNNITKTTNVIKKKNICVPVKPLNIQHKKKIYNSTPNRKVHTFHKNDKFDILGKLGDDVFRYILSSVKNKNLLLLNKRCCQLIRSLRIKLIYDESLKSSISPDSIMKTIYLSESIEILDLSGCSHLTSHHFHVFSNSNNIKFQKTLKILCLKNCNKISDSSLKLLLHRFKNLEIVDIRNCYKISHEGIYPLKFKHTLKKLYMGNITSSNVTNCHSNDSLKVLFNSKKDNIQLDTALNNLIALEIINVKLLDDISHLYMIANNLKILNFKGCPIDDTSSNYFQHFKNLLALNLSETNISNHLLNVVIKNSTKLKVLDISKTHEILNNTILEIPKKLKHLKKVKLSHLQNVDNFCLREFFKYCKDLTCIDFSNCWKVNNTFCNLNGLEIAAGNKLKDIGAYQCSIDRKSCEGCFAELGCISLRVHVYNELFLFETSIYTDIKLLEDD